MNYHVPTHLNLILGQPTIEAQKIFNAFAPFGLRSQSRPRNQCTLQAIYCGTLIAPFLLGKCIIHSL